MIMERPPEIAPPKLDKQEKVKHTITVVHPVGYHYHQCQYCRYIWGHMPGDSHVCPNCRRDGPGNRIHYNFR